MREQDAYVSALGEGLEETLEVGRAIGGALEGHATQLNRFEDKSDRLFDATRAATRVQASIMGSRESRLVGHVALRCADGSGRCARASANARDGTVRFVSARRAARAGGGASRAPAGGLTNACRWELHQRVHGGALGLRAPLTQLWLGINMVGHVRLRAYEFGPWEEWDISARDAEKGGGAPLLCCASHWGKGGWARLVERKPARDRRRGVRRALGGERGAGGDGADAAAGSADDDEDDDDTDACLVIDDTPATSATARARAVRFEIVPVASEPVAVRKVHKSFGKARTPSSALEL